jgi:hypothetical protein
MQLLSEGSRLSRQPAGPLVGLLVLLAVVAASCSTPQDAAETPAPVEQPSQAVAADTPPVITGGQEEAAPAAQEEPATQMEAGAEPEAYVNPLRGHAWAEPVIDGDVVTITVAVAASEDHVHFTVPGTEGDASFIGWLRNGEFEARPVMCPCCGAEEVQWGGTALVCRNCDAVFDLEGGVADDSCAYPEGTLPAEVLEDVIVMSLSDLVEAYDRTAAGEDTLFEPEPEPVEEEEDLPPCCRR